MDTNSIHTRRSVSIVNKHFQKVLKSQCLNALALSGCLLRIDADPKFTLSETFSEVSDLLCKSILLFSGHLTFLVV